MWSQRPPIPDDEAVEAIADFNLNLANLRATSVKKGQRFRRDDPLVKKHPEFFQVRRDLSKAELARSLDAT